MQYMHAVVIIYLVSLKKVHLIEHFNYFIAQNNTLHEIKNYF